MSIKIWTKLIMLLTALTFTIVAIFWLKQGHMSAFWTSLGFNNSGKRINWCEERVSSLYFYDTQTKLFEKDAQWMISKAGQETVLDYLRVEKWFAQYCQIPIEKIDNTQEISDYNPSFEAHFLNGERLTLNQNPEGVFKIRSQVFKSETLRQALKELLAFGSKIE